MEAPAPRLPPLLYWLRAACFGEDFPSVEQALEEPNGLLAVGGDLHDARLLAAYRRGIFPWYEPGEIIQWWAPDPRCVLFPQRVRLSRSLSKSMKKQGFRFSFDRCFEATVRACAAPRPGRDTTWITPQLLRAYVALHRLGHAHSVEVWQDNEQVGGLFGVAIGAVFFGESMFSRSRDASKAALVELAARLQPSGCTMIDCQLPSPHLERLGARCIARRDFSALLERHLDAADCWRRAGLAARAEVIG